MVSKVLKVFYDSSYLPYKDSERTIHFPVGGNTFAGTQNTFRICFYPRDLVGSNDLVEQTSWVLVSKLPNGQLGYQLLNTIQTDSDLGEKYLVFDLSSYYSQYKGVVKLAIRGYQGEIEFTDLDDEGNELPDGAYRVIGTPIIGVTGTIDIAINYSPMVYGEQLLPDEFSQLVAKFDAYLSLNAYQEDSIKRIVVIDSDLVDYSDYDDGQLFYRKDLRKVMQLSSGSLIDYDFGYIANGNYDASKTLEELATIYGLGKTFVLNYTNSNKLICSIVDLGITNQLTYNIFNPYGGVCWQDTLIKTITLGTIVNGTPNRTFTTKSYVDNAIDTALIGAYKPQGNASVSTLNGLTKSSSMNGYVYNMTDSGNLTNQDSSTTSVLSGDNVVLIWDNGIWHWDNLVGSNYVEKTTSANKVYGTNELGAQTTYTVDDFYDGNIARRDTDGSITVPLTPTQNGHASSKKYVDDEVDTKQDTLVSGTNIKTLNGASLLGSGNIDYDTALNESSTNAVQNLVIAKDIREINYELAVIRESLFETVLTELPYKVDYATEYLIPSTLSDDDGTHRVVFSKTQLDYFEGNGFVYNQLQSETFDKISYNVRNGTRSYESDNTVLCNTISTVGTSGYQNQIFANVAGICIVGHKYLIGIDVLSPRTADFVIALAAATSIATNVVANTWKTIFVLLTDNYSSGNHYISIQPQLGADTYGFQIGDVIKYRKNKVYDLTQSGIDSATTVDEAIALLQQNGVNVYEYNPYSAGEIKNTSVSGLYSCLPLSTGTWEQGTVSAVPDQSYSSNKTSSNARIRVVSLFQANATHNYLIRVNSDYDVVIQAYNSSQLAVGTNAPNPPYNLFATGEIRFSGYPYYAFAIKKTDGSNIAPSELVNSGFTIVDLDNPDATISFTPTELLGALSAHDTLSVVEGNVVEGEQRYNLIKTSNTINVSAQSLSYISTDYGTYSTYFINVAKKPANNNTKANLICNKYITYARNNFPSGNGIAFDAGGDLDIKDSSLSGLNTTQVRAALEGVYFQIELATPTTTTIATDLTFEQVTLLIQEGGTIGVNFTNVPPNVQTKFVVKKAVGE